jgi:hypothetical protein
MSERKIFERVEAFNALLPSIITLSILSSGILAFFYIILYQDKIFIAILSVAGTLFVQRYLEGYRSKRRQDELAKLLIIRINRHLPILFVIRTRILFSEVRAEIKALQISQWVQQIKDDEIYKDVLKQSGIFPFYPLKYVSEYVDNTRTVVNLLDISTQEENAQNLNNSRSAESIAIHIISHAIDGVLCCLILNKLVLKEEEEFQRNCDFIEEEYRRNIIGIQSGEVPEDARSFILSSLNNIEEVFRHFGLYERLQ